MKQKRLWILLILFPNTFFGQENLFQKAYPHLYSNQDSAYYYLEKQLSISNSEKDWLTAMEACNYINHVAGFHKNLSKFQKSLEREDELYKSIENIDSTLEGIAQKHAYWYDKGNYYYQIYEYERATKTFFELLNSIEQLPDSIISKDYSDYLTVTNNYLATIYQNQNKYEVAEEFYNENLRLHAQFNDDLTTIYDTQNLISALKSKQEEYDEANKIAKESITYYLENTPGENLNSLRSTSILLIRNYTKTEQLDSAIVHLKKIAPFIPKNNRFYPNFLKLSANIEAKKGNYQTAIAILDSLVGHVISKNNPVDDVALILKEKGDIFNQQKKWKEAKAIYKEAIAVIKNKNDLIDASLSNLNKNEKMIMLQIIEALTSTNGNLNNQQNTVENIEYGNLAITFINKLRSDFYSENDKQILVESSFHILESAIESAYKLYIRTGDVEQLNNAFTFFEQSKSSILLDALSKNRATLFSGIPDSLLQHEQLLKINIANLEKNIQLKNVDKKDELFQLKREHEKLIAKLEANYKEYYNLKYKFKTLSLTEFQQSLNSSQEAVSYFEGTNVIYALKIGRKRVDFVKIPFSKKEVEMVTDLHEKLSTPKSHLDSLNSISHNLYSKLITPLEINGSTQELIIIPDGKLRVIPFGVLIYDEETKSHLAEHMAISYSNSATLWENLRSKPKTKNLLAAFAPTFNSSSPELGALPNNKEEIENIDDFFKGDLFKGNSATLQKFDSIYGKYNIIHLATHAVTNDHLPEYSFLAFSPSDKDDYLIYVNDLYSMQMQADLITLSACETGLGQLKKGEGNLSLARAFFYSGAQSLVNTLWKINDKSSSELMGNFYKKLSDGKSKNEALQEAKLEFLVKYKDTPFEHPYYWSSFIVQGNTSPLVSKTNWMLYSIAVFLALLLFFYRKKLFKFVQ